MFSDRMQGKATDVAATTMSSGINANMVLQDMQNEIVQSIIASILSRTFPVTVVSRDGNALVLSQGGQAVKTGNRYAIVSIGKEMKDPQTGESLGRLEVPCCEVVIDKVASKLSYGHIENVTISLNNIAEGGLQLREQVKVSAKKEKLEDQDDVAMEKSTPKKRSAGVRNEERSIQESKEDGKW
jgi:hypothetical protein